MKKSKNKIKVSAALLLSIAFMIFAQSVSIGVEDRLDDRGYAETIGVNINGMAVVFADQTPVIVDGRTLVPVRGVFEELGFEVDWNPDTRTAILESADFLVLIPIDSEVFTTNGEEFTLDVPAQIINGRTMLPIRAVVASVGYDVDWDSHTRTVLITSPEPAEPATATRPPEITDPSPGIDLNATVWLSRTGVRYHRINNCGNMNPATARSMTRQDARARGYSACANCW